MVPLWNLKTCKFWICVENLKISGIFKRGAILKVADIEVICDGSS
jgi:hypothetical protein